MTTQEEIDVMFASLLGSISQICNKTTFTNVSRNVETIKGEYRDMLQFCKNHHKNPWHSIADGDLPKTDGRYIVMAQNGYCHTCQYHTDDRYWDTIGYQSDIKYWMEIPELPTD